MSAILYPVAASAEEALAAPLGRAVREREAAALADTAVAFVTEETGPAFQTREAALDAFHGWLDDERPGRQVQVAAEDRFCALRELAAARSPAPVQPSFAAGRRWPAPAAQPPKIRFRLAVSYWRIGGAAQADPTAGQARTARRKSEAAALTAEELQALARQPLRPVRPQQPLDSGLFESPAPEAPHILIPDD